MSVKGIGRLPRSTDAICLVASSAPHSWSLSSGGLSSEVCGALRRYNSPSARPLKHNAGGPALELLDDLTEAPRTLWQTGRRLLSSDLSQGSL